jgi:TetR/AcrR family fatty acid metabolism transcriptional regulator
MSPRVAVEEQQEERRRQLLRATFDEVSERGFSVVTLDDIAQRAGVSKGVLLYYFNSKEELFLAAFTRFINALGKRQRAAADAFTDPVEKLKAIFDVVFAGAKENRHFHRAYLDCITLGVRNDAFGKVNEVFYRECIRIDEEILREGKRRGVFHDHADAAAVRALWDGFMMQWLFDPKGKFEDYRKRYEKAVWSYLLK